MEAYVTTCSNKACGHVRTWIGYKTGMGKTSEQLAQMEKDRTTCILCGSPADTTWDRRGLIGAMDAQNEQNETREGIIKTLMEMSGLSRDEVITSALILLGFAVKELKEGFYMAAVNDETKVLRQVEVPAIINARKKLALQK